MSNYALFRTVSNKGIWRVRVFVVTDEDSGDLVVTGYLVLYNPDDAQYDVGEAFLEPTVLNRRRDFMRDELLGIGYLAFGAAFFTPAEAETARLAALTLLAATEAVQQEFLRETQAFIVACGGMPQLPPIELGVRV